MSKSKAASVLPGQASIFSFFSKTAATKTPPAITHSAATRESESHVLSPDTVASKASTPSQAPLVCQTQASPALNEGKVETGATKRRREPSETTGESVPASSLRRSSRRQNQPGRTAYTVDEDTSAASISDSESEGSGFAVSSPQETRDSNQKAKRQERLRKSVMDLEEDLGKFHYENDRNSASTAASQSSRHAAGRASASGKAPKRSRAAPKSDAPAKKQKGNSISNPAEDAVLSRMKKWKAKEERKAEKEFLAAVEDVEQQTAEDEWQAAVSTVQESIEPTAALESNAQDGEGNQNDSGSEAGEKEDGGGEGASDDGDDGMTSYERERQANIRRNNAFLMNLGIDLLPAQAPPKPKPKPKAKQRAASPSAASRRSRRSTRSSSGDAEASAEAQRKMEEADALEVELQEAIDGEIMAESEEAAARARVQALREEASALLEAAAERKREARRVAAEAQRAEEEEEEEELNFDDSSVKRYTCCAVPLRTPAADLSQGVAGLGPLEAGSMAAPEIKRIYSVSFRPGGQLVAGGGHGGYAGVWAVGQGGEEDGGSLMTWQAHKGWLGEVHFLSQQTAESNLLLTASNDQSMVLWDVNSAAHKGRKAVPRRVAEGDFHRGGLFSLHEVGGAIVSSGKDGDVVLSRVTPTSLQRSRVFEEVHDRHVIKCVRFRAEGAGGAAEPSVFASCGNDFHVRVTDTRIAGAGACVQTWEAAGSALNFVQWSPRDSHTLLSSSFDRDICVWDLRSTGKPLHRLTGHHLVPGSGKVKGMHRACFFAGGRYVAATGERSDLVSVYDATSGSPVSRGETDCKGSAVVCYEAEGQCVLAVASPQHIQIFTPLAQ